jgi:chromosome segregation ATPase
MSKTLINLDNQAKGKIFSFGSIGENSLLTLNAATTGTTVLDVKGSVEVKGNVIVALAPTANSHAVNKLFVDNAIATVNNNATALSGRVTSLESQVVTITGTTIPTLAGRVTTAEGNITTLQSGTSGLSGRTSTLEGEMDAVEGRLNTAEPKISTLETKMTNVQADVLHITGTTLVSMQSATSTVAGNLASEITNRANADTSIRNDFASADATTLGSAKTYTDGEIAENVTNKLAVADGIATLGSDAKILTSQLPDSVLGQVEYKGILYSGDTSTLPFASASTGHYFVAAEALTIDSVEFLTGDWIISDGSKWDKVDNTDAVATVFGRMGNISAVKGDYNAALITISGVTSISSDNVKGAIGELVSDISDEVTRATNAESALDGRLGTAETDIANLKSADTDIRDEFAAGDATTLSSANTYTDGKITQEISDRNDAILVEKQRAEGAEATLASDLASEVINRTDADAALQSQIDGLSGAARVTKKVTIAAGTGNTFNITESFDAGSLMVYVNGLLMSPEAGDDYSVSESVVTFNYSLETGDKVIAYAAI